MQAFSCAAEQHYPQHAADDMDEFIRSRKSNVMRLREIRNELEEIFTGILFHHSERK